MKAWKTWSLGAFVSLGIACGGGSITAGQACETHADCNIDEGESCLWAASLGREVCQKSSCTPSCASGEACNEEGLCVKVARWCTIGESEGCEAGEECRNEWGPQGVCRQSCADPENIKCGESEYADGYSCEGTACIDRASCRTTDALPSTDTRPSTGTRPLCKEQEACIKIEDGPLNSAGHCGAQTLGNTCKEDEECVKEQVCEPGVCIYGEREPDGVIIAHISTYELRVKGELVVPLSEPPHHRTGWLGPGAAQLTVLMRGPDANRNFAVQTGTGEGEDAWTDATCTSQPEGNLPPVYAGWSTLWTCELPEGWAGKGEKISVRVHTGQGARQRTHVWTYRVSGVPSISITAPQTALHGEQLSLCVKATTGAPLKDIGAQVSLLQDGHPLDLTWTAGVVSGGQRCWTLSAASAAALPLDGNFRWEASANAEDAVENHSNARYEGRLMLAGTTCAVGGLPGGVVESPLAFMNNRLAFGAGQRLYFIDALSADPTHEWCKRSGGAQIGTLQGPMVVLGGAQMAVALNGPPDRPGARLSVVGENGFIYTADMDCTGEVGETFDKGLSAISLHSGDPALARLASAVNGANGQLVGYRPGLADDRCIRSGILGAPVGWTPAQTDAEEIVVVHGDTLSASRFDVTSRWTPPRIAARASGTLSGIALGGGGMWLSSSTTSPLPALQLWRESEEELAAEPIISFGSHTTPYRLSPAAIDSQGRVYVVAYHGLPDSDYRLHRLSAAGVWEDSYPLSTGSGNLVGSPLLGQPPVGNDAEIYLVTSGTAQSGSGRIFALSAGNLNKVLWVLELGFRVSPRAQPLLTPNADGSGTLWVVGEQGQARGIRVASTGLHKTAPWPKAFRDNCNTSSLQVTPSTHPACF